MTKLDLVVTNTSKYPQWTTSENLKEMNGGYIGQISILYNTQTNLHLRVSRLTH